MIDDLSNYVFSLIGAIGSVATAGALVFLYYQSRQTQKQIKLTQQQTNYAREEMDITLRPYIGAIDVKIEADEFVTFNVKNYGRIPGRIIRIRKVIGKKKITKDLLFSSKVEDSDILLFPDANVKISSILPEESEDVYFAIMLEYEYYNNNHGDYGMIGKRVGDTDIVIYEVTFAH